MSYNVNMLNALNGRWHEHRQQWDRQHSGELEVIPTAIAVAGASLVGLIIAVWTNNEWVAFAMTITAGVIGIIKAITAGANSVLKNVARLHKSAEAAEAAAVSAKKTVVALEKSALPTDAEALARMVEDAATRAAEKALKNFRLNDRPPPQ